MEQQLTTTGGSHTGRNAYNALLLILTAHKQKIVIVSCHWHHIKKAITNINYSVILAVTAFICNWTTTHCQ